MVKTFKYIVHLVRPFITKGDTQFGKVIPLEKMVAITLWNLARRNFAVAKQTAFEITNKFCKYIIEMASDFIVFPKTERKAAEAIIRFIEFRNCQIPQVVDAIDSVKIQVIVPGNDNKVDYFNRKQHYSVNTQTTIGSNVVFLDLATGFPGRIHYSRVLRCTALNQNAKQRRILSMATDSPRCCNETYFIG